MVYKEEWRQKHLLKLRGRFLRCNVATKTQNALECKWTLKSIEKIYFKIKSEKERERYGIILEWIEVPIKVDADIST